MRALIVAIVFVLYAVPALAQTGTPTSWTLKIYPAGSANASQSFPVSTAQVQCNQAPPTGSQLNPNKWVWNDVANAGKVCIFDDTSRLTALADGNYEGTATATNADGSSAESARAPFVRRRPNPPAVPSGVGFTQ